ncbi:MAG: hypothetical protein R3D05_02795 [Dongiaceae bacterium]
MGQACFSSPERKPNRHLSWIGAAVGVAWLACGSAAANQISCAKSGVAFDAAAYSGAYEVICKKETVDEDAFDKLRASKESGWQDMIEYGRAFLPPKTMVEGTIMSSTEGRYGSAFMVTAIGQAHMPAPDLKRAIEAITKVYARGDGAKVTWRSEQAVGDYSVDFYGQVFPEGNVGGGPRECMGFVRYINGSAASHAQRVIGTYCELGTAALDARRAKAVLDTLVVRPEQIP